MNRLRAGTAWLRSLPRRERYLLAGAMGLALAVALSHVLATRPHELTGDEPEYHVQGTFFTMGKWWWSTTPFGIPHASAWKSPGYPLWVGTWYTLLGESATRVAFVQAFLAPVTVFLGWLLARRLFGATVAIVSAFVVAVFPLAWEYYGTLYPEALAIPATLLVLVLALEREPTPVRAAGVGALLGVVILIRPSSIFLVAAVVAAWLLAAGWRRGAAMSALTLACVAVTILPWTIRNYVVTDGFIPISLQASAGYGTFNEEAANDPVYPYAWRGFVRSEPGLYDPDNAVGDAELASKWNELTLDYLSDHPLSVFEAFYWNGITRFWDFRNPSRSVDEVATSATSDAVRIAGLAMYYVLLPLAVFALWRLRRRTTLVVPLLTMALFASLVVTIGAITRYRAPLEPVIAILACSVLAPAAKLGRPHG